MDLEQWRRWWRSDGFGRLRGLLLEYWDPIGGSPDDEYDDVVLQLGRCLRSGAGLTDVTTFLDDAERDLLGGDMLGGSQGTKNRRAAELILRWYASEAGTPSMTRDEALLWARDQARHIVNDVPDPGSLFATAQRIELVLCEHRWLDDSYPRSVRPFVWGWNVSGPEADRQIRAAARELATDHWFEDPRVDPAKV